MKIISKKEFPKKIIITVSVVLLIIIIALTYVYAFNGNLFGWKKFQNTVRGNSTVDYGPATTEQKQAGSETKSGSNSDKPPAPTTIPDSTKKNVQVTITAANQNDSILQIRVLISAVEDTGTCTLTLTSTGQTTVTKTSGVQASASTSTCQGFDIPTSELSVGTWHIVAEYNNASLTGTYSMDKVIK